MLSSLALLYAIAPIVTLCQQTGENTGWPRWCGKVYEAGYPSFNPGGQTVEPRTSPDTPLLHMQFKPRYSLYLEGETEGSFVVNAESSRYHGKPLRSGFARPARLDFTITLTSTGTVLVKSSVNVNTTKNLFKFSLVGIKPSLEAQNLTLSAAYMGGDQIFDATSELLYLPEKPEGSVTKVDNLYGGMLFRNTISEGRFLPLLPYGYYASYGGFLESNDTSKIKQYAEYGLNAITPLTQNPQSAEAFQYMDDINLKFMYNLREGYKNLTWVEYNVISARNHEALFAYWSVDEADGWQDPFNASVLAYQQIRKLDPYHPVAIVLNCQNYYFREYTEHTSDIIMEDVYPIGINSTFSKWGTACNTTLGDCGCDNCIGGPHAIRDVSDRLDTLARYERWEGLWPKMKVHNPQSFHGENYWMRDPTPEEEFAMCIVAFNHGAQGIISWVYPASEVLNVAHGKLAAVVTSPPVADFLVGTDQPHPVSVTASADVDVAYWIRGDRILVSIVNAGYSEIAGPIVVNLPRLSAASIESAPWGNVVWSLRDSKLTTESLGPLQTSMIMLKLQSSSAGLMSNMVHS